MSGHIHPLNCCGDDCCGHHGGMQCKECGLWWCALEISDEGLCPNCEDKDNNKKEEA